MEVLPLFKSHYSIGRSILTLEEAGSSPANGPDSIFDICKEESMDSVCLVEDAMTGYLQAYKNAKKEKMKLLFGLRVTACPDLAEKSEEALNKSHKVIIFIKNKKGYSKLVSLSTEASLNGFYYKPRVDYKLLKKIWSDKDLGLCIPFYDSFIYRNLLTSSTCIPEFDFTKPTYLMEDNGLPFDKMLRDRIKNYTKSTSSDKILETQSVFYKNKKDFKAYLTHRCINNRSSLDKPEIEHMCSNEFCAETWKEKNVSI